MQLMTIEDITVEVLRKPIRNLHLRVYPPDGRVRLSAPHYMRDADVHAALRARLAWIRAQQAKITSRTYRADCQFVTGERHPYLGDYLPLEVIEDARIQKVELLPNCTLRMHVRAGAQRAEREALLLAWYRVQLSARIPPLIAQWEPVLGVQVAEWHIKRMTTKWGTCNTQARRIWLSLELIKRPAASLEYVVVHEMVHLLERNHTPRFWALLDTFLPNRRAQEAELREVKSACLEG